MVSMRSLTGPFLPIRPRPRQGGDVRETLVLPARYCGPPRSANGGYVSGSVAHHLGPGTIEVTLRRPPPLDEPLEIEEDGDDACRLVRDGETVAEARRLSGAEAVLEPVPAVSYDEAVAASAAYPGHRYHPFPTCFSCGVDREDGLRIFPGPVGDPGEDGRVAAPWTPHADVPADFHEYADPSPRACLAATWAALDCISGWAGDITERPMVLGRMTARVDTLPVVGEPHVVLGQARGREGRRTFTASTLVDSSGRVVATAQQVWVAVDPAAFGGVPVAGGRAR